ncbi:MAG TPA: NAD(+)/NADH kinase, partial [Solirubrobacteraceae bacterium]|nr:NAD(+)/NADH kinase [Solirubrobacteraceae bacterium]
MSRAAAVFTHRRPLETAAALGVLRAAAARAGVTLLFDPDETRKHSLEPGDGIVTDATDLEQVELAFSLGGDGTILTALRRYAG